MMVIFLVGLVSMILMRTLRKDYARYSKVILLLFLRFLIQNTDYILLFVLFWNQNLQLQSVFFVKSFLDF